MCRRLIVSLLSVWMLAGAVSGGLAAEETAVVRGAAVLNVRAGPARTYQVVGVLGGGTRVSVKKVSGGWVLISSPGGLVGYVYGSYLDLPPGVRLAPTAPPPALAARAAGPPTWTRTPAVTATRAAPTPAERREQGAVQVPGGFPADPSVPGDPEDIEREARLLREHLADLRSAAVSVGAAAPPPWRAETVADLRADLQRILALTEGLRQQLRAAPTPALAARSLPGLAELARLETGVGLVALGSLLGFLIGAAYGRRQERRRRTRVRL